VRASHQGAYNASIVHICGQTKVFDNDIRFDMEAEERDRLAQYSVILRQDLKSWEKEFFAANSRKPSREEIKQNPSIGTIASHE
jgi:hypothetical protein